MRLVRLASAVLVVGGLVAGTLFDEVPEPPAREAGGFSIMAADFHVHAFPGDGALAPWALRRQASRVGLDVFPITNHNRVFPAHLGRRLAAESPGPIVIVGQEITAATYHVIALGIETTVDSSLPAAEAIQEVHRQGGVAIAAHPEAPQYTVGYDERALMLLDGVERAHPIMHARPERAPSLEAFYRRTQAVNPGIAAIGSSDFHVTSQPGRCRTYVLVRERSAAGVIEAIRAGRSVAADANGTLYGDPRWVGLVESAGGFVPPAPATRWQRTATAAAWVGLFGLLVVGGGRERA